MMSAIRVSILGLAAVVLAPAQGTTPKAKPSEYPLEIELERGFTLAAEYLVRAIPTPNGSMFTDDYLVVEVAFFGPKKEKLALSPDQFRLRMTGPKIGQTATLAPQPPTMVAGSLRMPDFNAPRTTNPTGQPGERPLSVDEWVRTEALPDGIQPVPAAGLLYFQFRGKPKTIRTLDLVYEGPAGKATLKLP
jgi:hypothetical protein